MSSADNRPLLEKMGLFIRTNSYAGLGNSYEEKKYFEISRSEGNSCGPYVTYLRKEVTYVMGGLLLFIILGLIKLKKTKQSKKEFSVRENSQP